MDNYTQNIDLSRFQVIVEHTNPLEIEKKTFIQVNSDMFGMININMPWDLPNYGASGSEGEFSKFTHDFEDIGATVIRWPSGGHADDVFILDLGSKSASNPLNGNLIVMSGIRKALETGDITESDAINAKFAYDMTNFSTGIQVGSEDGQLGYTTTTQEHSSIQEIISYAISNPQEPLKLETTLSMKRYFQNPLDTSVYPDRDAYNSMMWSGQVITVDNCFDSNGYFIGSENIFIAAQKYTGIMAYQDTITFLTGLFSVDGANELKDIIVNLGNETNGTAYSTGVITGYMLMAVNDFRNDHPDFHFKVAAQAFAEDQNWRVDAGTFVQGLQYSLDYASGGNNKISSASMKDLVKNIDQLVVHPLENSETAYTLDVSYFNYYYSTVNELRKVAPGIDFNPKLNASAWSGECYDAASGGISNEERLIAAENILASFVSMLQMGADAASYFGLDYYKYSSYTLSWEGVRYANFYVFKWLAESTPGKYLVSLGSAIDTYDSRSDTHSIATFMDAHETVLFFITKGDTSGLSIKLGDEYGDDPEITYDLISKGSYKAYDADPTSNTPVELNEDGSFDIFELPKHSIVRVTIRTPSISRELPTNDGNSTFSGSHLTLGGDGNDLLIGHADDDFLDGGAGNDSLYMDDGNDTLNGGSQSDWLYINGSTSAVVNLSITSAQNTGFGHDTILNIENISGGSGSDKLYGTNGGNVIQGNDGNDSLYGGSGNDRLVGGNGNDRMLGGSGNDTMYGGAGNDSLYLDYGNDYIDGGYGTDWMLINGNKNAVIKLYQTSTQDTGYGRDIIKNIENISAGSGNDKLYGTSGNNNLRGNDGNDSIYGGSGNDRLVGGNGNDRMLGGFGNDTLYGGTGNDSLHLDYGNDYLDGGHGTDWMLVHGSKNAVIKLYQTSTQDTGYGRDIIKNIENISAGSGNDKLYGTIANNSLQGNNGNDSIYGGHGNDRLVGGNGNDLLLGQYGNDTLYGGSGNDRLMGQQGQDTVYGAEGNDSLYMDSGNDTLDGGWHNDWLIINGTTSSNVDLTRTSAQNTGYGIDVIRNIENIAGGSGADNLRGTSGDNYLRGRDGDDRIYGHGGDDTLSGGNGSDVLYGQSGNDTIYGGAGKDRIYGDSGQDFLAGGLGADCFVFRAVNDTNKSNEAADIIFDFQEGFDKIDISMIYSRFDDAYSSFHFKGMDEALQDSQDGIIYKRYDLAGSKNDHTMIYINSEMSIKLMGLHDLSSSDFIF